MDALGAALTRFDADEQIAAIIITGNEKAFAAGMDIAGAKDLSYADVVNTNMISRNWEIIRSVRKPVIAAVNGYTLGGGSELAMMCDLIVASEDAKFGQPAVKLGIPPGAGGTQRTAGALGTAKAMVLCPTRPTEGPPPGQRTAAPRPARASSGPAGGPAAVRRACAARVRPYPRPCGDHARA